MRKGILVVTLAALMALMASAATYAATLSANGYLGFRTVFAKFGDEDSKYEFRAQQRTYGNIYVRGSSGPVSATFRFYLRGAGTDAWRDMSGSGLGGNFGNALFHEAYADYKGAIVPGLVEGTLRAGRFVINENDWIGRFERREGLRLSGVQVGPANLSLVSFWPASPTATNTINNVTAVKAQGNLDIVDLTAMVVTHTRFGDNDNDHRTIDYVLSATATPIRDLEVTADFASNGKSKASTEDAALAWKVGGELSTIPNLTLRASTWSTDSEFRPAYYRRVATENLTMDRTYTSTTQTNAAAGGGYSWGDPWMETGFSIGATTTQAGLPIEVDFKTGTIFKDNLPGAVGVNAPFAGKSMTVVSAATKIAEIDTKLSVTTIEDLDQPVIDVVGSRKVAVGFLGGDVDLRGTLRLQDLNGDDDPRYAVDAIWSAPNRVVIGLHYANYDRYLDWNHNWSNANLSEGFDIGESGKADGFAITAGYILNQF